jgi:alpha-1,2-glucosyltransferase
LQQRQHQQQQSPAKGSGGSNGSSSVSSRQQQEASQQQHNQAAELFSLLGCAWQHKGALVARFWLLLLLPAAFCVFVVWNGSITLGDKEAHAPSAHLMQPLYFGLFLLSNAALLLLQPSITGPLLAGIKGRPLVWIFGLLASAAGGVYIAERYSLAHPYLLADNRHYTFYIWRKVTALLHRHEPWMRAGRVVSCLCMHTSF